MKLSFISQIRERILLFFNLPQSIPCRFIHFKFANQRIERESQRLDQARKDCGTSLQALGKEKAFVLNYGVKEFLDNFSKIKNVNFNDSEGLNEINKFHIDRKDFEELNEICEELITATNECKAISKRCYMFYAVLIKLDTYLYPLNQEMKRIIQTEGTDYSRYRSQSRKSIAAAVSTVKSIKTVLDTTILPEKGELTEESAEVAEKLMEETSNPRSASFQK